MKSSTQLSLPASSEVCIRRRFVPRRLGADWFASIWEVDNYILLLFSITGKDINNTWYLAYTERLRTPGLTTDLRELFRNISRRSGPQKMEPVRF